MVYTKGFSLKMYVVDYPKSLSSKIVLMRMIKE